MGKQTRETHRLSPAEPYMSPGQLDYFQKRLLRKINAALARIEDGSYGYCLESGEEIGLRRLEAVPTATLSVEMQEQVEHRQRFRQANLLDGGRSGA